MDLLTAIHSEPLEKIQEIVLRKELSFNSSWLDYDILNRALECKRKDVAKWLINIPYRVNKASSGNSNMRGNTPLHNAVKLGDMEIVEMLLEKEASIVAIDFDDNTALHLAFLFRYDKITDLLLGHMVKISNYSNVKNNQGLGHMHIASTRNNVQAIEGFLKAETDVVDAVRSDSPSSWAGYTALHFAIEFRSLEAAKMLLAAGSKMEDYQSKNTGQSPLQLLHQQRDEYLIMSDHLDESSFSYFHVACLKDSASMVKKFIDRGANVNDSIEWPSPLFGHHSALHLAVEGAYDREEKVQLLLCQGIEHFKTFYGMTALHLAFYYEYNNPNTTIVNCLYEAVKDREENVVDKNKLSYFHVAVTRNDFDRVKRYLDEGANINQAVMRNDRGFSGYTALHFAVKYELVGMVKLLIEQGANVNAAEDCEHHTPLSKAYQLGNKSLIDLLKSCARVDLIPKSAVDALNNTLLHCAAKVGNHEVVQCLVNSGSEINARNDFGQTPLLVSLKADFPSKKVIESLLDIDGIGFDCTDDFGDSMQKLINSSAWLREDMERFAIYKIFLERGYKQETFHLLWTGSEKEIEMLLQTDVDLSQANFRGATLVHMLTKNVNPGAIEILRGRTFDINAADKEGWTPLMYAACDGNFHAVEFLLNEGADVDAAEIDGGRTALFIACVPRFDGNETYKKTIQVLLELGANTQIELSDGEEPSIFHMPLEDDIFLDGRLELILAHLVLQEANGTAITPLIRGKIDSDPRFESYFKYCKQQLSVEIVRSVTLFNVLTSSDRKLERYMRNKDLAAELRIFQTVDYFYSILKKRLAKATVMIELRKTAAPLICKFMRTDYDRFPCIADEIVGYLEKRDLESLISIENDFN